MWMDRVMKYETKNLFQIIIICYFDNLFGCFSLIPYLFSPFIYSYCNWIARGTNLWFFSYFNHIIRCIYFPNRKLLKRNLTHHLTLRNNIITHGTPPRSTQHARTLLSPSSSPLILFDRSPFFSAIGWLASSPHFCHENALTVSVPILSSKT